MTLSTAGKNWLAINAGVNYCFSPTDVSFVDADGVAFTAGTKDVVIVFIGAHMGLKDDAIIIANTSYNGFKAINGSDLAFPDATLVYNSDGHVGATLPLYCAPTPTEAGMGGLLIVGLALGFLLFGKKEEKEKKKGVEKIYK